MGLPSLIEDVIGEEGKKTLLTNIYEKAKGGSFLHQQLLMHYLYGKPTDSVDVTSGGKEIQSEVKHTVIFKDYSKNDKS